MENINNQADNNLTALGSNPYPGRGIIIGKDETDENFVMAYWIMGRSENSRNRIFVAEGDDVLKTEAADASKVQDPSLIIYKAMDQIDGCCFGVSNGAQTDLAVRVAYQSIHGGLANENFAQAYQYEPDEPNFTSRITGILETQGDEYMIQMSLLSKSPFNTTCEHHLHTYRKLDPGFGYCITTYEGDGDPLPAFNQRPYLLPLNGTQETILNTLWRTLDEKNKISLAVKFINAKTKQSKLQIINKYEKVTAE